VFDVRSWVADAMRLSRNRLFLERDGYEAEGRRVRYRFKRSARVTVLVRETSDGTSLEADTSAGTLVELRPKGEEIRV
jgi:hypothetical protein